MQNRVLTICEAAGFPSLTTLTRFHVESLGCVVQSENPGWVCVFRLGRDSRSSVAFGAGLRAPSSERATSVSVSVGAGQFGHFYKYAPEKIPYSITRYTNETRRLLGVLEKHLEGAHHLHVFVNVPRKFFE